MSDAGRKKWYLPPERRAEELYRYFYNDAFYELHLEEMFRVGRGKLKDTDRFWNDWITLLKEKNGDMKARLLKEAVLYRRGADGLPEIAEENASVHPSLYLSVMTEYEKERRYEKIEEVGKAALEKIDADFTIRGEIAIFPMEEAERKKYLAWAERIVYARADAIVSGRHRNQYGQVAALLTMAGEITESMGTHGAQRETWARDKSKFPRHSSFQKEMRDYFNM